MGLVYAHVSHMFLATSIEYMYRYAYFGLIDVSYDDLTNESIHTWISAFLTDMANSRVGEVWGSYGVDVITPAKRCLEIAELATARSILEGSQDIVFYFAGKSQDEEVGSDYLTIRQMALLAGMEEMSIRAAANPKRANPLPTLSIDGRTRVSIEAAKNWLISKGRYIPIKRVHPSEGVDLQKFTFKTLDNLLGLVFEQIRILETKNSYDASLNDNEIFELFSSKDYMNNKLKIEALAKSIKLDGKLLMLKVREAIANEELAMIDAELKEISK